MKKIYIAGPFRAKNAWLREQQIRRAEEAGFRIAELGAVPIIPHSMYRNFDGTVTDEFWIEATADLLLVCDAILLIPGWRYSSGSRGELAIAENNSIEVFATPSSRNPPVALAETIATLASWLQAEADSPVKPELAPIRVMSESGRKVELKGTCRATSSMRPRAARRP